MVSLLDLRMEQSRQKQSFQVPALLFKLSGPVSGGSRMPLPKVMQTFENGRGSMNRSQELKTQALSAVTWNGTSRAPVAWAMRMTPGLILPIGPLGPSRIWAPKPCSFKWEIMASMASLPPREDDPLGVCHPDRLATPEIRSPSRLWEIIKPGRYLAYCLKWVIAAKNCWCQVHSSIGFPCSSSVFQWASFSTFNLNVLLYPLIR